MNISQRKKWTSITMAALLGASALLNVTFLTWSMILAPWRQEQLLAMAKSKVNSTRPVVLIGDSILADLQPSNGVLNLSVSGATVSFVKREVLPSVFRLEPRRVIVALGINDLRAGVSPTSVASSIESLVQEIEEADRSTEIIVLSVLPMSRSTSPPEDLENESITELNEKLAIAARIGAHGFVDYSALYAVTGALDDRLTYDGLHPNTAGQAILHRILLSGLARD